MNMQQQKEEVRAPEVSPHLRQRMAFMSALISDPASANWAAISDTWDDLSHETKGTVSERQIQALDESIRRKDALRLTEAIGALLKVNP